MERYEKVIKNNKFKISAPTWNEKFDRKKNEIRIVFCIRYSRLFLVYLKKHGEKTGNPSRRMYISKIENRITFKIKTGNYLRLLTLEIVKLLGSTEKKISKYKNGEHVPHLEITEVYY